MLCRMARTLMNVPIASEHRSRREGPASDLNRPPPPQAPRTVDLGARAPPLPLSATEYRSNQTTRLLRRSDVAHMEELVIRAVCLDNLLAHECFRQRSAAKHMSKAMEEARQQGFGDTLPGLRTTAALCSRCPPRLGGMMTPWMRPRSAL